MAFRIHKPCETTVRLHGFTFEVDMAFDNVLDAIDVLNDTSIPDRDKIVDVLSLLVGEQYERLSPDHWAELAELIMNELFEGGGADKFVELDLDGNPMPTMTKSDEGGGEGDRLFDMNYDATYIYSSFYHAYGIDLHRMFGKLHWHEFRALLRDLPDTTIFAEIQKIRATKMSEIKDKKEAARMRKLKNQYRLPGTVEEREESF